MVGKHKWRWHFISAAHIIVATVKRRNIQTSRQAGEVEKKKWEHFKHETEITFGYNGYMLIIQNLFNFLIFENGFKMHKSLKMNGTKKKSYHSISFLSHNRNRLWRPEVFIWNIRAPKYRLYSSVAERWSCKPKAVSSILTGGTVCFTHPWDELYLFWYYIKAISW